MGNWIIGRDFRQGQHHKTALVRTGMRKLQFRRIADGLRIVNNVQIQRARRIAKTTLPPELLLNLLQLLQKFHRRITCFHKRNRVNKIGLIGITNRRGAIQRRGFQAAYLWQCRHRSQRILYLRNGIF